MNQCWILLAYDEVDHLLLMYITPYYNTLPAVLIPIHCLWQLGDVYLSTHIIV
jgi:hypothetical protein